MNFCFRKDVGKVNDEDKEEGDDTRYKSGSGGGDNDDDFLVTSFWPSRSGSEAFACAEE